METIKRKISKIQTVTYTLNLIIQWLNEHNIKYTPINCSFYIHGIEIDLYEDYKLSIQTHSDIVVSSLVETALKRYDKVIYILDYEYDVIRWNSLEDLYKHILKLQNKLKNDK